MTLTAPETQARTALNTLITRTFSAEGFPVANDRLHGSLGSEGTRIGISPVQSRPRTGNSYALRMEILVQFYGKWNKEINPNQKVDPAKIEGFAERFRQALRTGDPDTSSVWYFSLDRMSFPPDPTGNITRFEATIEALGNNTALLETTG
jgi:hypothetical protein